VPGIDVASYQHKKTSQYPQGTPISWTQVGAAGYRFAAVKATEGEYYINPWEATDVAGAKAAGLYVTAYHFAIPNGGDGASQARFAIANSGYVSGPRMLPMMLDIEYDPYVASDHTNECYGLSPAAMTSWLAAFVATARQLTGQDPVIYTTADWWNACTGGSTAFGADPMWVAAYGFTSPPMPAGWPAWTYWQYTSAGTVPGVATPGASDLSRFNLNLPGLVSPGLQASRPGARVALEIPALATIVGTRLTYTVSGLPPGLWITPNGLISGRVGAGSSGRRSVTYHVTVSATAAGGGGGAVTFSWQVNAACGAYLTTIICPGRS
jgi:GH25 family lysozyme M1 (1,4-beta-N-acetylmuramidase)